MNNSIMYKMVCAKFLLEGIEMLVHERFRSGQDHCGLAKRRKTSGRRWE